MPTIRRFTAALLALLLTSTALHAAPASEAPRAQLCGYALLADIQLLPDHSVRIADDIRIAGDRLWIGTAERRLDDAERVRLRQLHRHLAHLIPAVARAARTGLHLGLQSALSTLAGDAGTATLAQAERARLETLTARLADHWPEDRLSARAPSDARLRADLDALAELLARVLTRPLPMAHAPDAPPPDRRTGAGPAALTAATGLTRQLEGLCREIATVDLLENSLGHFDVFRASEPSI